MCEQHTSHVTFFSVLTRVAQLASLACAHHIPCVISMRSCCVFDSLQLLHFPLFAVCLLSYHPVFPPGHQLHLPRCGGEIPCALQLMRALAPLPSTTLSHSLKSLASAEDFSGGTVTEFPGLRQQQQRHPTPSAPAANVSPSAPTRFWRRLCPPRDKTGQPAGGTGGQTWNSRHSAWRVGRSRAPFTVLAELSRWLEGSQGLRGPWAPSPKLPICHQQGTSTQACLMDQSVAWALVPKATWERLSEKRWLLSCNVGSASPTLVARCRHPPASSMEELEKIDLSNDGSRLGAAQLERLKLTRESNSSQVIRAHECELQRDLGVMPGEPWSYHRHARHKVLHAASRTFASRWPRGRRVVAATSNRPPWARGEAHTFTCSSSRF